MVAEYLYDALTLSSPVVIGQLPATPSNVTAIMEYSSNPSTEYFGGTVVTRIANPVVKFICRNDSYATGQAIVESIREQLDRLQTEQLLSVFPVGSPMYLGRGQDGLHEFQVTFKVQIKE